MSFSRKLVERFSMRMFRYGIFFAQDEMKFVFSPTANRMFTYISCSLRPYYILLLPH
jgi:hypothetical protein